MDELIDGYSRAEALADGVLIDASGLAAEAGFSYPVALTAAVHARCVSVPDTVGWQDETGRLWDILMCLRFALVGASARTHVRFVVEVQNEPNFIEPIELVSVCGPGDGGEPVITIMFPGED